MNGIWTDEGIQKLNDAFAASETVDLTHFALSGDPAVGGITAFTLDPAMTEAAFPNEQYRANIHNSFIDTDGYLVIECWIDASITDAFFSNGIGIIHDEGANKFLMAIADVPLQERKEGVFQKFFVKLPLTSDQSATINVSFRSEDSVTPAELKNSLYTIYTFTALGPGVVQRNNVDGLRVVNVNSTIVKIIQTVRLSGTSGSTIIDINAGNTGSAPSTVFTTQGNRPTLATGNDWGKIEVTNMDITALTAGQIITMDLDQLAAGVQDITVQVICLPA